MTVLHGYFRSTASWRVRIALALKHVEHQKAFHHLRKGEHREPGYLALNPQGLLPALELDDGCVLTQSLAICEYLDDLLPEPPLLPRGPYDRARVRAMAQVIACDIHPVQNLKVLARLRENGLTDDAVQEWARLTIDEGLTAFAALLDQGSQGAFCFGDQPGLADLCLIPQLGNARRFGVQLRWPRLQEIENACAALPAFQTARPDAQPDAE
ncbi:maleylacetoacetate isomerase [Brevundimonas sp. BAL450]|uniref:maleylacetoacetate isomerase n=1 Tax=Brevundimonas sp. BAL450 TaxID=1708162 RepID=UPI0018C9ABD7|nr:maleylacetoacetate isomerase [Brevundimonas sp. BAL450]MBG7614700.1 maleylacetoacetate isomerase [Brevundimonas sp. BAL450]